MSTYTAYDLILTGREDSCKGLDALIYFRWHMRHSSGP
jgi:hypothetical protein